MKKFSTIAEQMDLLTSRGLKIHDRDKASLYLLTNNYYNIINGYGRFFPRSGENYTAGTSFNEIAQLYLFDREIKQSLFNAILSAENHIKASFAYRFAEKYPNIPFAYLNTSCYNQDKTLSVVATISRLSYIIEQQKKKKHSSINHYLNHHGDIPIWVLSNSLNFGELRYMISLVTTDIQNQVAKDMLSFIKAHIPAPSTFLPETMISFIDNIHEVRNVCAHNNRLLDFHCRHDSRYWKDLHDLYNVPANSERNNVYSVFISLQCFLSLVEYGTLHNKLLKLMLHLDKHIKTISTENIYHSLGFPTDWCKTSTKIQY